MKVVQLHELTPRLFEPEPNPQNSVFWSKARIEGDFENICCFG